MKLLIVDDEKLIREVINEYAKLENFEIMEANNGEEALDIVNRENIDLIILDIMMPKMDGLTFLREMKKTKDIPVIILSARGEEYDKLTGFNLNADDYITKPFSPKELMARVKAVLKRCKGSASDFFEFEDLKIDFKAHSVYIGEEEIRLTPKEYELLIYFTENENIALSRDVLLNKLWGYDFYGDDRTVDTHIKMLRNNLGKYRDLITTVRGVGYKFVLPKKQDKSH